MLNKNLYYEKLKDNEFLWDIYSNKEEYDNKTRDNHNRFLYKYSKNDSTHPIISEYLLKNGCSFTYPNNAKFAICLSHDVDNIIPPFHHKLYAFLYDLKNVEIKKLIDKVRTMNYNNFDKIISIEEKYNAKSTFFFLTSKDDIKRVRYTLEDYEEEVNYIKNKGWDVGLHGGYFSYNDLNKINNEKKELEKILRKKILGYRGHYLRFQVPDTWEILAKAGFKYDSTFGYSDFYGFRNGICHPFIPINRYYNKPIDIIEIPLVIMDSTILKGKKISESLTILQNILKITEKYNGVLTVLFHNDIFSSPYKENWYKLFNYILKLGKEKNAYMTSCDEMYHWWKKNYL